MKKRIIALIMMICLSVLCIPQSAFAKESDIISKEIDLIYEEAYEKALIEVPEIINSDEEAYAYILSHMDCISRTSDGIVLINEKELAVTE